MAAAQQTVPLRIRVETGCGEGRYSLCITQPEHEAITGILKGCHKQSPAESTPSVAHDEVLLPCKQFQLLMLSRRSVRVPSSCRPNWSNFICPALDMSRGQAFN